MIYTTYEEMHNLISTGQAAFEYAWAHFENLSDRPSAHVLYGPPANYLGIFAAGHLTPAKKRKLLRKTNRSRYITYELNEDLQVIRVRHIKNDNQLDCTYHVFEYDGLICAVPFFQDMKMVYPGGKTVITKTRNGRPEFLALASQAYLCVDYYEYPQAGCVETTCYLYFPQTKFTASGLPVSKDAPFGSPNSPVSIGSFIEEYNHIDFLTYLK